MSDQLTANKRRKNQTLRPLEESRGIGHPKIQIKGCATRRELRGGDCFR